jgi:uncharacterized membrane protein
MVAAPRDVRVPHATHGRGRVAALLALSAVAFMFWTLRSTWTGPPRFGWFLWNLALAWIPWLAARAVRSARTPAVLAAAGGLWLLFLPNAPYLLTDLVHLRARPPVPLWFDVLFFASFALAGCALGWAAVEEVQGRLAAVVGRTWAALGVAALFPVVGFGVYLGRFERWNSWDLFTRPGALLGGAASALGEQRALAFSAGFGLLVAAGYLLVSPSSPLGDPARR